MRRSVRIVVLGFALSLAWASSAAAQVVTEDEEPPVVSGNTVVQYRDGSVMGTTTYIQSGSVFASPGSGGSATCNFYTFVDFDGDGEIDDVNDDGEITGADQVLHLSHLWRWREITEGAVESFADIVVLAELAGISIEEALESYGPIEGEGWRRFELACGGSTVTHFHESTAPL